MYCTYVYYIYTYIYICIVSHVMLDYCFITIFTRGLNTKERH